MKAESVFNGIINIYQWPGFYYNAYPNPLFLIA